MADSYPGFTTRPSTRADSIHRNNFRNNYTRFVGKLLFFTFFLIAIPFFPSQAPDFINQTILNKFWELLHLMFIGIAVSYGLFGCRNFDNGNLDDSQSYVSGMFHVPSIFEDGFSNSMYDSGQGNGGFFNVKNGTFENPDEENVFQAWSSKYFQGEPMVVLAQPNYGLQKHGESGSFIDYKPLGLPVRSLKSRVGRRRVNPEFGNGSSESSGPSMEDSSDSSSKNRNERFDDLGSESLEGKFNESDILGSPIPWRSRSERMRERVRGGATRPSHFRPLSVDETQFESLKSCSLRSTVSFNSQASSQSHSPSSLSPEHSHFSESPKSQMSELAKERSPRQSFPHTSPSIPKPVSSKASAYASHSRQYSDGSALGTHARKCFEDELKELCDSKKDDLSSSKDWISGSSKFDAKPAALPKASSKDDLSSSKEWISGSSKFDAKPAAPAKPSSTDDLSSKEWITGSLKFDAKPAAPTKASSKEGSSSSKERISSSLKFDAKPAASRGKSVRTFRSFRASVNTIGARDAGEQENHRKGKLTMGSAEIKEACTGESEPKIGGHNNLSGGFNRQNLAGDSHMLKPTSPKIQKNEKHECPKNSAAEFGEDLERENEDFQVSLDEETMSGTFSLAGSDTSEVDRKAGEFIAKFREQIRLQRTTSIDTPRGLNMTGNFFW